ncbi:MAG: hypothetical protein J7L14_03790 [Candidatus Diapherotrites archaeon]|nr:hypothetical protein [Candidatus Diapherotrites archaeon]
MADKVKVQILSRYTIKVSPAPGQEKRVIVVTYTAPGIPARTLWIDEDKYSDEALKAMIREDMEKAKEAGVEEIEL